MIYHQILFKFNDTKPFHNYEKDILNTHLNKYCDKIQYKLWNLEEANAFVKTHYPIFDSLMNMHTQFDIIKCDFFRYLIMYHYGGIYTDIDFLILKPLKQLLLDITNKVSFTPMSNEPKLILSEEWFDSLNTSESLHNGILISLTQKHPFWLKLVFEIYNELIIKNISINNKKDVYEVTGPKKLAKFYLENLSTFKNVVVIPYFYFCPYNSINIQSNEKKIYNDVFVKGSIESEQWFFFNINEYEQLNTLCPKSYFACIHLGNGSMWKSN